MPFPISVLTPVSFPAVTPRRVTVIRFARAISGFAEKDAPDLDNRGGVIRTGHGQAHGPVVGLLGNVTGGTNHQIRVKIMRDRVEAAAQLYPELESSADVSLVYPSPGQPLSAVDIPAAGSSPAREADCVYMEAASTGDGDPETKLKIRYGSATGPVIGELGVVVYKARTIYVQAHTVTINGPAHALTPAAAAATMSDADIRRVFSRMDRIYTQAGIRVILRSTILRETVNGFTERGTVTLSATPDHRNTELQTVLNQNPHANSMNAYIFNQFRDTLEAAPDDLLVLGIAFSRRQANANPPAGAFPGCQAGFTLRTTTDLYNAAHTAAHEIGHSLELEHYGGRGGMGEMIEEIWANRNLMKNVVNTFQNRAVDKVGYGRFADGSRRSGSWLGTKKISTGSLGQPDQIRIMRNATVNGAYKPVSRP
jgi:hypothetical protein